MEVRKSFTKFTGPEQLAGIRPGDLVDIREPETHFAVCHKHKLAWSVGWNLMSGWRREDQKTWDDNRALLETYQPVEPYFWPRRSA